VRQVGTRKEVGREKGIHVLLGHRTHTQSEIAHQSEEGGRSDQTGICSGTMRGGGKNCYGAPMQNVLRALVGLKVCQSDGASLAPKRTAATKAGTYRGAQMRVYPPRPLDRAMLHTILSLQHHRARDETATEGHHVLLRTAPDGTERSLSEGRGAGGVRICGCGCSCGGEDLGKEVVV
jgi:hypothetical protein